MRRRPPTSTRTDTRLPYTTLFRTHRPAQLSRKSLPLLLNRPQFSARKFQPQLPRRAPVRQVQRQRRAIPPPSLQVSLADRIGGQSPLHIHAVHVQPSPNAHRRWKHARRSAIDQPVHHQIPIMRRQPHAHPIAPVQPPAERQPHQLPLQRLHSHASLISISGTDGASPAAKVVRLTSSRSSAKRTGTSNRNPAVSTVPSAEASSKAITPLPRCDHPLTATPSTPTDMLPATGRVISRCWASLPLP